MVQKNKSLVWDVILSGLIKKMYLIVTRNFPPEVGGMQNLMWGLSKSLSKLNMLKVFADYHENCKIFDEKNTFSTERIGGPKLLRKFRKSYLINEFLNKNKHVSCVIADHWKSLELIKSNKKKICLIHSKEINHKKGTRLNNRVLNVLNNIDYVISNSNYTKNLAIDLGVQEEKIIVINNSGAGVGFGNDNAVMQTGQVGSLFGIPVMTSSLIPTTTSTGIEAAYLVHKSAIAVAVQQDIRVQSEYDVSYLGTKVVADIIYGAVITTSNHVKGIEYYKEGKLVKFTILPSQINTKRKSIKF